jgi:hypothetical protein
MSGRRVEAVRIVNQLTAHPNANRPAMKFFIDPEWSEGFTGSHTHTKPLVILSWVQL